MEMSNDEIDNINELGKVREIIESKFAKFSGENYYGFAVGMSLEASKELLKRGELKEPSNVIVENGRMGYCHEESLQYWLDHCKEGMKIIDGYACSDEMWVKHAWCVDKKGNIHECTSAARDKYYGYELTEREVGEYCKIWGPERVKECLEKITDLEKNMDDDGR